MGLHPTDPYFRFTVPMETPPKNHGYAPGNKTQIIAIFICFLCAVDFWLIEVVKNLIIIIILNKSSKTGRIQRTLIVGMQ